MVPEQNAVPIPDGVDLATAAVLTCAGMTAMHATKLSDLRLGDTAVVDGIGGVGILVVQAAAHAGARVIAVGDSEEKLQLAQRPRRERRRPGRHRRRLRRRSPTGSAGSPAAAAPTCSSSWWGRRSIDDGGHPLARQGRAVRLDRLHRPADRDPPDRVHPAGDVVHLDRRGDPAGPAGRAGAGRGRRDDACRSPAVTRWRASTTRSARCASARCSAARCSSSPDRRPTTEGGNAMASTITEPPIDFLDEAAAPLHRRGVRRDRGEPRHDEPGDRADARRGAARDRARGRRRGRPRPRARSTTWRFDAADAARASDVVPRRPARGEQGRVRDDRGPRQRQADVGGAGRRHRAHDRAAALLRGLDHEDRRARSCRTRSPGCSPSRKREPVGVVAAITPWNFPLLEVGVQARAGARGRMHDRGEALGARAAVDASPDGAGRRGRVPARRRERRDRRAGRRRARSCGTPACSKIAFTGQTATGKEIMRTVGRRAEARDAGARRQEPEHRVRRRRTSTPPRAARSAGSSSTRGRPASPARGCSSRRRSPTSWSARVAEQAGTIRLGHGPRPADADGAADLRAAPHAACCGYVESAREQGAEVAVGGGEASVRGARGRVLPRAHRDLRACATT